MGAFMQSVTGVNYFFLTALGLGKSVIEPS